MKPTYYGCAFNGNDTGILAVTVAKVNGRTASSQEWTGETFPTWGEAEARVEALNSALLGVAVAS